MRLIDADALIEKINEIYQGYMTDECGSTPCDFEAIVEEQPTAYDIDEIVEELENKCISPNDYPGYVVDLEKAIDIVGAVKGSEMRLLGGKKC